MFNEPSFWYLLSFVLFVTAVFSKVHKWLLQFWTTNIANIKNNIQDSAQRFKSAEDNLQKATINFAQQIKSIEKIKLATAQTIKEIEQNTKITKKKLTIAKKLELEEKLQQITLENRQSLQEYIADKLQFEINNKLKITKEINDQLVSSSIQNF